MWQLQLRLVLNDVVNDLSLKRRAHRLAHSPDMVAKQNKNGYEALKVNHRSW
jgi:hypothetical protein